MVGDDMCLTSVDHVYAKTEDEATEIGDIAFFRYCIQSRLVDETGHVYYYPVLSMPLNTARYRMMKWEKSEAFEWHNRNFLTERIWHPPYPVGFHVFKSEDDARRYAGEWKNETEQDKFYNKARLLKVMVKRLIATGKQNINSINPSYDVEIYHERMIVEELDW
jgi:hypothetical protein